MTITVNSKTEALIFDIDGTLADNMPVHFRSWQNVVQDLGGQFPEDLFYEWAGIPTREIIIMLNKKYGTEMDTEKGVELKEKYFFQLLDTVKPIKAVISVAKKYKGILPMACGTGGRKKIALRTLELLSLEDYFPVVVSAEDVTKHKPSPETFLRCAELLQVDPRVCQVFEDGDLGIEAAHSAGMMVTDVRPYV